ncbi:MAG: DNA mismatch repair protein MutS [Deltaproteobacteria bacterium]|nr:MAG: DNA mismatch repair protein MutS [Deltaproteobacteria bacterium]
MNKITPMIQQYLEIKRNYQDAILFYRMGDFYEMFFDDALKASKLLDIVLTSRNKNAEEKVPMCGIPYHAASGYINRLISQGLKVAVCEQKDGEEARGGLVKREVVRIVTPGLVIDGDMLEDKVNNFIVSVYPGEKKIGLSSLDISTGEFRLMETARPGASAKGVSSILDEIARLNPAEIVTANKIEEEGGYAFLEGFRREKTFTGRDDAFFAPDAARECLLKHFKVVSLEGFGCENMSIGIQAAGALLQYVQETQKAGLDHIQRPAPYFIGDYLIIDDTTRRNLELSQKAHGPGAGGRRGSLLDNLDITMTSMGGRMLRRWMDYPLRNLRGLQARLEAVSVLKDQHSARREIRAILDEFYDLERLNGRIVLGNAMPRDLLALKSSLLRLPDLIALIPSGTSDLLKDMAGSLDPLSDMARIIEDAIREDAPLGLRDGGIIKEGYSSALDELISIQRDGKDWIARLEAAERVRAGISNLRVGFNRVFGYYIEVTKSNLSSVPGDYIRKQTLVNAERFITPELKDYEEKVLTAGEKRTDLEYRIFQEIRLRVAAETTRIQKTAHLVAQLDVLASFAESADRYGYVCPKVNDSDTIFIRDGRHPVVERTLKGQRFVPNSVLMDNEQNQMLIITGPNMAGKSTILRQVALIVLMAHMGSFVPAEEATIGLVDRIFSRVGAMDDLARGQSTFMVEMMETANILNNATEKSLVIMDEIGRGTSTFDGLSIAWAVAEYLLDKGEKGVRTLFATHYHELAELAHSHKNVKNYNVAVKEWNEEIIFLHRLVPGSMNYSYGIQVARLAGLPEDVVRRAKEILKKIEGNEFGTAVKRMPDKGPVQLGLFSADEGKILRMLKGVDIVSLTPLDALNILNELQRQLK